VPDVEASDTSESAGSSVEGEESGGAAQSAQTGGEATDWKAKYKELERAHAKVTGKAGATQATLTEQITAQSNRAQSAEAEVAKLQKELQTRDVLEAVTDKVSDKRRGAVRAMALGILPGIDLSDPTKAAQAVLDKIAALDPEALKSPVQHMPHSSGDRTARTGFAFASNGKRLV
jgi:hypothetical protein